MKKLRKILINYVYTYIDKTKQMPCLLCLEAIDHYIL